jgi:NADH-quinone oxidoreductase subunit C
MGGTPGTPAVPTPSAEKPGPQAGPTPGPDAAGTPADPSVPLHGKDAVFAAFAENSAVKALAELATDAKFTHGELTITVAKENIVAACEAAKVADWYPQEPRFQVSYHILSHALKQRLRLVVQVDSTELTVPSITSAWPSANFYEREVFDLFGIHFSDHPRLTRIMMPENWVGHPLRKDYPVEGYR